MSGATFDTGMLVALDRNEREAWVVLRRLISRGDVPTIPTVVTAQAWRYGRHQVATSKFVLDGSSWTVNSPQHGRKCVPL